MINPHIINTCLKSLPSPHEHPINIRERSTKSTDSLSHHILTAEFCQHGGDSTTQLFWERFKQPARWGIPSWDWRHPSHLYSVERPAGRRRSKTWRRERMEDIVPGGAAQVGCGCGFHGGPTSTVSSTEGWPQCVGHVHSRARIHFAAVK